MKIDGLRRLKTKNLVIILLLSVPFVCFGQTKYFEISQNSDIYNAVLRDGTELRRFVATQKNDRNGYQQHVEAFEPYTVFIPKSDKNALTMMTTGMYGGIGAIIMQKTVNCNCRTARRYACTAQRQKQATYWCKSTA